MNAYICTAMQWRTSQEGASDKIMIFTIP